MSLVLLVDDRDPPCGPAAHTVGVTGFAVLDRLLRGEQVGCGEHVVDGLTGTEASIPGTC